MRFMKKELYDNIGKNQLKETTIKNKTTDHTERNFKEQSQIERIEPKWIELWITCS